MHWTRLGLAEAQLHRLGEAEHEKQTETERFVRDIHQLRDELGAARGEADALRRELLELRLRESDAVAAAQVRTYVHVYARSSLALLSVRLILETAERSVRCFFPT